MAGSFQVCSAWIRGIPILDRRRAAAPATFPSARALLCRSTWPRFGSHDARTGCTPARYGSGIRRRPATWSVRQVSVGAGGVLPAPRPPERGRPEDRHRVVSSEVPARPASSAPGAPTSEPHRTASPDPRASTGHGPSSPGALPLTRVRHSPVASRRDSAPDPLPRALWFAWRGLPGQSPAFRLPVEDRCGIVSRETAASDGARRGRRHVPSVGVPTRLAASRSGRPVVHATGSAAHSTAAPVPTTGLPSGGPTRRTARRLEAVSATGDRAAQGEPVGPPRRCHPGVG